MRHPHNDSALTWGCEGCIQRVKDDQLEALAREVIDMWDGYLSWPSVPFGDALGAIDATHDLCVDIRRLWDETGWDDEDLEDMFDVWDMARYDHRVSA